MSLSDYNCLINASLFDGGVCALVFFSLWESTFCIVRLRSVCRLHVHVSYVSDALRDCVSVRDPVGMHVCLTILKQPERLE